MMGEISYEKASALFDYDPSSGIISWASGMRRGLPAGRLNDRGYRLIWHDGRGWRAHRLAWLLTFRRWPTKGIDHLNGDKDDNRLSNLRECDQSQNMENSRRKEPGKSGFHGVTYDPVRKRYRSVIVVRGKRHPLGYFKTGEAASRAYEAAKAQLHVYACATNSPSSASAQEIAI